MGLGCGYVAEGRTGRYSFEEVEMGKVLRNRPSEPGVETFNSQQRLHGI